jgi:hypothetical protein
MATSKKPTKEQKEQLVQTLKFTPRTYQVTISGYGGEIAMGRVDPKTVAYFKKNKINLDDYATSWGEPGDDDYLGVPEKLEPFTQGSWYDCDNIEHNSGAEFGGAWLTINDEEGNEIFQQELNFDIEELGCEIECFCEEEIGEYCTTDSAVFVGQSFEKGCFFEGDLHLTEPFDIAKFKFTYSDIAGWPILNIVEYAGEELDGSNGYSTTGKSMSFNFYYRDNLGELHEYCTPDDSNNEDDFDPVAELDKIVEEHDISAFQELANALAERWNDVNEKPPVKGEYEVKFAKGVWPLGDVRTAEWTGRSWKENGKKAPEMLGWREVDE